MRYKPLICALWIALAGFSVAHAQGPNGPDVIPDPAKAEPRSALNGLWQWSFRRPSGPPDPDDPDGVEVRPKPEYTPEFAPKAAENKRIYNAASTPEGAGPEATDSILVRRQSECIPYGMPRMMSVNSLIDIVQGENRILMVGETEREVRWIWLDREQLPLDEVDLGYFGRSVGRWDGNVLHVNTIGIRADLEGQNYMPHTEDMVIDEKIWVQGDTLFDEVTVTDPVALKKPWTFLYERTRAPSDYEPTEWVCDMNRFRVGKEGNILTE